MIYIVISNRLQCKHTYEKKRNEYFTYYTQFVKFIFYEILMNSQANYDLMNSH